MKRSPHTWRLVRGVLAAAIVMCMAQAAGPAAHAAPLTIATSPTGHLLWIAEAKGFFKDVGEDVAVKEFSSGVRATEAMLAGDVTLATSSEFAFVNNIMNHGDLRILAGISRANSARLFARKDRGIASVFDLIGRRVGVTRHAIGEFFLGEYLSINGISMKQVDLVGLSAPKIVDAIADGTIDAAITWEPFVYRAAQALGDNFVELPEQGSYFYHFLLIGRQGWIDANRNHAQAILRALLAAETFAAEYPAEAQNIIATRFGLDRAFVRDTWPRYILEVSIIQTLLSLMEQEARWLAENGLADPTVMPDFLEAVQPEPLLAVAPKAVRLIR